MNGLLYAYRIVEELTITRGVQGYSKGSRHTRHPCVHGGIAYSALPSDWRTMDIGAVSACVVPFSPAPSAHIL